MVLRFGEFELDHERFELRRSGTPVALEPKPFDVLRHLVAQRDVVISKDTLLASVWPDEYVTESVLHRCVSLVRKALDDDKSKTLIQTVRGRGYRFTAEVEEWAADAGRDRSTVPISVQEIFLGRDPVLAELRRHFASVVAGTGRIVLLVGEPGIGKTRTLEAFLAATSGGVPAALVGRCFEGDGAPPFWPWVQVVRALRETRPSESVSTLLERLEGAADDSTGTEAEQRFRLFDDVGRALEDLARDGAAVVVLEDLHWADAPSLLLLQHLAVQMGDWKLLLVATLRDERRARDHPFARMRGELARLGHVRRIRLEGLDREQVGHFLELTLGRSAPRPLIDAVFERTEGNPLFVREVVRWLRTQGQMDWAEFVPAWEVMLPDGLRDVLERRIDSLGSATARTLEAAAVIGREFAPDVLAEVLGEEPDVIEGALEIARSARVIEPVGPAYTFSHALVRDTLVESLSGGARADLHARAGEALEKRHADDLTPVLGELAHHFFEAYPVGGEERALEYSERAAEAASRQLAWEEAAAHLERAVVLSDRARPSDPARQLELLRALGRASRVIGDVSKLRESFYRAAQLAGTLGRPLDYAELVLDSMGLCTWGPVDRSVADPAFERAFDGIPPGPGLLRARLVARRAAHWRDWGDSKGALSESEGAVAMARELGDPSVLAEVLMSRLLALRETWFDPGGMDASDAMLSELRDLVIPASGSKRLLLDGTDLSVQLHGWSTERALLAGDGAAYRRERAAGLVLSDASQHPMDVHSSLHAETSLALLEGRNEDARAALLEEVRHGSRFSLPWAVPVFLGSALELGRATEDLDGIADAIDRVHGNFPEPSRLLRAIELAVPTEAGRAEEVRSRFAAWADEGFENLRRDSEWLLAMTDLSRVACGLGERDQAALLFELLAPHAALHRVLWGANLYMGPVALWLAELARLLGRGERAREFADLALSGAEGLGAATYVERSRKLLKLLRES